MFVEQSHQAAMPSPVWLHINGISLPADVQQYHSSSHVYDYRTKHLQSPSQPSTPRMTPASNTIVPYNITIIDGPFQHTKRQHQKLENLEMSKRMYMDRQLRKAKSLPGLIKGTAFSRQAPLQSASFIYPMPPNSTADSSMHDMMMPASSFHHHDGSLPLSGSGEQSSDSRRPRVYFADFNKIEFVEDKKDNVQQRLPNNSVSRRHRPRLIKKSSSMNASIHQPQTVENFSRSLSRQQYVLPGQEFNVKKQQLNTSTRTQPVHATIFPDISNTSLPRDAVLNDNASGKNVLTGDKTLSRLRKVAIDLPINISLDVSRDHKRPKRAHSSSVRDAHNQAQLSELADQEAGAGAPRRSSIVSSSFNNRHRPTNRTVPLRQQFISPFKTDSNQYQSQQSHYPNSSSINVRRSASLKHVNARLQDDLEDVSIDEPLSINNRSIATRTESAKVLKRGHVVHFNSKTSLTTPAATETHEMHRQPSRATTRKSSQERFQNLLTIVRPPYITGSHGSSSMPVIDFATSNGNSTNPTPSGIGRSIRRTSAQGPLVFHITSNTIVV